MSHELVGVIIDLKDLAAKVQLKNRLDAGDPVEYLTPCFKKESFIRRL
ncbi:MAG: hypothetical protein IT392_05130 [Nitrospirae bacterium]|nr:hypothetical protein [Nitrospirota bacterium]